MLKEDGIMNEYETGPKQNAFVGEFELSKELLDTMASEESHAAVERLPVIGESAMVVRDLLSTKEIEDLRDILQQQDWVPVGVSGMKQANFDPEKDRVGSYRATAYDTKLAAILWQRIASFFPDIRELDEYSPTDWDNGKHWRPVGVNPLHRFIKYEDSGSLLPHYDAPFVYDHSKRTLMSLVLYLDKSPTIVGGATRFLHDPQAPMRVADRNLNDWSDFATEKDVRFTFDPQPGSALLFDHRILHDSGNVYGKGQKLLLRTDIDFERADE